MTQFEMSSREMKSVVAFSIFVFFFFLILVTMLSALSKYDLAVGGDGLFIRMGLYDRGSTHPRFRVHQKGTLVEVGGQVNVSKDLRESQSEGSVWVVNKTVAVVSSSTLKHPQKPVVHHIAVTDTQPSQPPVRLNNIQPTPIFTSGPKISIPDVPSDHLQPPKFESPPSSPHSVLSTNFGNDLHLPSSSDQALSPPVLDLPNLPSIEVLNFDEEWPPLPPTEDLYFAGGWRPVPFPEPIVRFPFGRLFHEIANYD